MDIYITRKNTRIGPFNEARIVEMLQAGIVSRKDMAWREGLAQWIALGEIVQYTGPVPTESRSFRMGRGLFRILVGLSFFFLVVQITIGFVVTLPEPLKTFNDTHLSGAGPLVSFLLAISFLLVLGMMVASYVGLFLIHKWGRLLFPVSIGFGITMSLFMGPDVESAISSAAGSLFDMSNGALLAIAWFTPLFDGESRG